MSQTKEQYLLGKIAKECAEVAQRANKISNFGIHEIEPNHEKDNLERLFIEYIDLVASMEAFLEHSNERFFHHTIVNKLKKEKKRKIEKFYEYSKSLGRVE